MKMFISLITLTVLILSMDILFVKAEEKQNNTFSVKPIITNRQTKDVWSYVSINPKSEVKEIFGYLVSNETDKDITIKATGLNALTSPNGVIKYIKEDSEDYSIITDKQYSFSQYIKNPEQIVIPKGHQKVINIEVNIPMLEGTILGGIEFSSEGDTTATEDKGTIISIKNELRTVIAFQVNFSKSIEPKFDFSDPYIHPMPSNYVIRFPIGFESNRLVTNSKLRYEVLDENNNLLFDSRGNLDYSFTPNTKVATSLIWDNNKLEKKHLYTLTGDITYTLDGKETVVPFKKTFGYTGKEDAYGNSFIDKSNVDIGNYPNRYYLLLLILPLLIILSLVWRKDKKYVLFTDENLCLDTVTEKDNPQEFKELKKHNKRLYVNNDSNYALFYSRVVIDKEVKFIFYGSETLHEYTENNN